MKTTFPRFVVAIISLFCCAGGAFVFARPIIPPEYQPKGIALDRLEKEEGARFGDWTVWRMDSGEKAICLINSKAGMAIYLPWASNGWINHRSPDGTWFVLFSSGKSQLQDRGDLRIENYLGKRAARILGNGNHLFDGWSVKVSRDAIEFHLTQVDGNVKDHMIIQPWSSSFTHNGRTIGP